MLIVSIALADLTETAMQTVLNYFLLGLKAAFSLPLLGLSVRRFADARRRINRSYSGFCSCIQYPIRLEFERQLIITDSADGR